MTESAQERWLTYAEMGQLFGCTPSAARMLAKRRGWVRRTPNMYGERARVLVPDDELSGPRSASYGERTAYVSPPEQPSPNGHDQGNVRALEQAVAALSNALAAERARSDQLQAAATAERARVDQLQAQVDSLRERLMIALVARRPWWRRWFR